MVAIGPVVSEEKSFEIVDGRRTEPAYTISSPGAFGSGELKSYAQAVQSAQHVHKLPKYTQLVGWLFWV